jgi:hypothetical protein
MIQKLLIAIHINEEKLECLTNGKTKRSIKLS